MTLHRSTAVALLLSLPLAACDHQGKGTQADAGGPVTLRVFADSADAAPYRALVDAYADAHPGRRVDLDVTGKWSDRLAGLAGNRDIDADVVLLDGGRFGEFARSGALEPVGPGLSARGFDENDYFQSALDAFRRDGTLICAPQDASSLVVYYNRALFQKYEVALPAADWTFRDLVLAAQGLTRDTDDDGQIDLYGLAFTPDLPSIAPFVWSAGGELFNDPERPSILTLDRADALKALALVKGLNTLQHVVPAEEAYEDEDSLSRFERGGAAMLLGGRALTPRLRTVAGLDWDVAAFPRLRRSNSLLQAQAYCLSKTAANRDAALDLIGFAVGEAGQRILAQSGQVVPTLKRVANSPAFLDPEHAPRSAQVFIDAMPNLRHFPAIPSWNELRAKADPILEEWFFEIPEMEGAADPDAGGGEGLEAAIELRDVIQPILIRNLKAGQNSR